jgi:hypothetical protein
MGHTDELERLAALHRSGSLSDEEFIAAKAKLLQSSGAKLGFQPPLVGVAIIAVFALGAGSAWFYLTAWPQLTSKPSVTSALHTPVAKQSASPQASEASGSNQGILEQIFQREMLDAQVPYLERITGPARNIDGDVRTYIVNGCEVRVTAKKGAISALALPQLSKSCTVSLKPFGLDGPSADQLTFAAFDQISIGTTFTADCISSCGNAFDPSVYELVETPHSNDFLDLRPGVVLDDNRAIDASENWADGMKKLEGEDFVTQARFNCDHRYSAMANNLFKTVRITSIEVGHLKPPDVCSHS